MTEDGEVIIITTYYYVCNINRCTTMNIIDEYKPLNGVESPNIIIIIII